MASEIRIRLSQLSCLQRNGLSWPNRVLFVFAFRAGPHQSVEFAGPRWMVDGETIALEPPQLLFRAPATDAGLAIAIRGEDLGRHGQFEENAFSLELLASSVQSALRQERTLRVGRPWEAGVQALESGIEELVSAGCSQPIFSFSKVYSMIEETGPLSLSHTISNEEGGVASRYKLRLLVDIEEGA